MQPPLSYKNKTLFLLDIYGIIGRFILDNKMATMYSSGSPEEVEVEVEAALRRQRRLMKNNMVRHMLTGARVVRGEQLPTLTLIKGACQPLPK